MPDGVEVVRDAARWSELWNFTCANEPDGVGKFARPHSPMLDFGNGSVVALFVGDQPTLGHALQVTGIEAVGPEVVLAAAHIAPGPSCRLQAGPDAPGLFVFVQPPVEKVRVEWQDLTSVCPFDPRFTEKVGPWTFQFDRDGFFGHAGEALNVTVRVSTEAPFDRAHLHAGPWVRFYLVERGAQDPEHEGLAIEGQVTWFFAEVLVGAASEPLFWVAWDEHRADVTGPPVGVVANQSAFPLDLDVRTASSRDRNSPSGLSGFVAGGSAFVTYARAGCSPSFSDLKGFEVWEVNGTATLVGFMRFGEGDLCANNQAYVTAEVDGLPSNVTTVRVEFHLLEVRWLMPDYGWVDAAGIIRTPPEGV
jgi:hypothetical protein